MTSLQGLPLAIRLQILRYLLLAPCVRQPPNDLLVEHYNFEVGLLRVSKAIKRDAESVFYGENKFVKIKSNFTEIEKSMNNHEVPFFRFKRIFNYHVAEITVAIDSFNGMRARERAHSLFSFILLLQDSAKYARLLRILDMANFMGFNFRFTLTHPPPISALSAVEQYQLLLPFEQLRGSAMVQPVTFKGPFNTALVKHLNLAMTQKVAWLRAGAWEIYNIALSIKRVGDQAFRSKNPVAYAKYNDTVAFLTNAKRHHTMMEGVDSECGAATDRLAYTAMVEMVSVVLSDFCPEELTGNEQLREVVGIEDSINKMITNDPKLLPAAVTARFFFLLGVAQLKLSRPVKAGKALAKSYQIFPSASVRIAHDAAKVWKCTEPVKQQARMKTILASLPTEPFPVDDMPEYSTPVVESEKWVMRELGYKGSFHYEDKIKGSFCIVLTDKPHRNHHNRGPRTARIGELKPDVLRQHVDKLRRRMSLPAAQGRLICWVALGAGEIGEDTILDQLDNMSLEEAILGQLNEIGEDQLNNMRADQCVMQ